MGAENIVRALSSLPPTVHPLEEANRFVFDTWTQPAALENGGEALFVSLHGNFAESKIFRLRPRSKPVTEHSC
jgi:hypothetical protein